MPASTTSHQPRRHFNLVVDGIEGVAAAADNAAHGGCGDPIDVLKSGVQTLGDAGSAFSAANVSPAHTAAGLTWQARGAGDGVPDDDDEDAWVALALAEEDTAPKNTAAACATAARRRRSWLGSCRRGRPPRRRSARAGGSRPRRRGRPQRACRSAGCCSASRRAAPAPRGRRSRHRRPSPNSSCVREQPSQCLRATREQHESSARRRGWAGRSLTLPS